MLSDERPAALIRLSLLSLAVVLVISAGANAAEDTSTAVVEAAKGADLIQQVDTARDTVAGQWRKTA